MFVFSVSHKAHYVHCLMCFNCLQETTLAIIYFNCTLKLLKDVLRKLGNYMYLLDYDDIILYENVKLLANYLHEFIAG